MYLDVHQHLQCSQQPFARISGKWKQLSWLQEERSGHLELQSTIGFPAGLKAGLITAH